MRQKLYLTLSCLFTLLTYGVHAQTCADGRYYDQIFNVGMTTVTYSDTYSLQMDIYQPVGDTLSARPVIILAHEGTFVSGDKESDLTVDSLCVRFAKRGYVTVSIDYRLSNFTDMVSADSSIPINEVMQAVSDGKAAIRYFVKDRATTNTYKIDTNNIFIGGNSAGAVLYMHVGYIDSEGACPSDVIAAMDSNGGFEGNSGNPGYTTRSKAIIDLAGGLNRVSFVELGGKPSVNCQGSLDQVVPYYCADAYDGAIKVELCGLGSLQPQYTAESIYNMSLVFPGAGHVPWDSDPAQFDQVDSIVRLFLYNYACPGSVASVNTVHMNTDISLFPNPASDVLDMKSSAQVNEIAIYDETGRIVMQAVGLNTTSYEINTSHFSSGMYFVKITFKDENNTPVIKRVIVE